MLERLTDRREVDAVPKLGIQRRHFEQDLDLVGVVDFLDVNDSHGDLAGVEADTVRHSDHIVGLASPVGFDRAGRRASVALFEIAVVALFRRNENVVSADRRTFLALA